MPSVIADWSHTKLWQLIDKHTERESQYLNLKYSMPIIQAVLAQGGTAATDFTLHDAGHAFRVAERMATIIPSDVLPKLPGNELALLLLSAYLHDIGMTPDKRKVTSHHQYIVTGEVGILSDVEINELQSWVDKQDREVSIPLCREKVSLTALQIGDELTTYYSRYKHNDWSEEWIREHLASAPDLYTDWLDDLVRLCKSHHYGYHELIKDSFSPRIVGSGSQVVNLRYLACVLRIADILEFDPERTPEVIFRHRDVSPSSTIYWWKDHHISLLQQGGRVVIHATPPNARIHKAIELMIQEIDQELRLCSRLSAETQFNFCPLLSTSLPHRWDMESSSTPKITPKEGAYIYIDGAFRPNTRKLLEMLSGIELYGTPWVALRELLQNSFDAVKEQIAHERLMKHTPEDPKWERVLGELHTVHLRFETSEEGYWLTCSDDGVGMTLQIIKDHLLVSGSPPPYGVKDLERRCAKARFTVGRTGQFGIGVLSYFLLADRVVIHTKRSQDAGDSETVGWRFETEGVGSFGELRQNSSVLPGTKVALHLRAEHSESPSELYNKVLSYIDEILVYLPCRLEVSSTVEGLPTKVFGYGWAHSTDAMIQTIVLDVKAKDDERSVPLEYLSDVKRQQAERQERDLQDLRGEVSESLCWLTREGQLPNSQGRFRINIPYFSLSGGKCLGFLRTHSVGRRTAIKKILSGYLFIPSGRFFTAWKGMSVWGRMNRGVHAYERDYYYASSLLHIPAIVEADLQAQESGKIAVSRNSFIASRTTNESLSWLREQVFDMYHKFITANANSIYSDLNARLGNAELPANDVSYWISKKITPGITQTFWEAIRFPAISSLAFAYSNIVGTEITWKRRKVSVIRCIPNFHDSDDHYSGLPWNPLNLAPDRVVEYSKYPGWAHKDRGKIRKVSLLSVTGLWEKKPEPRLSHIVGLISNFPQKWNNLCGVRISDFVGKTQNVDIWNSENPLLKNTDPEGWEWTNATFKANPDPVRVKAELLLNRSRTASWVLRCLQKDLKDLWEGLKERDPTFLEDVWQVLFPKSSAPGRPVVLFWVQGSNTRLRVLSPQGWIIHEWTKVEEVRKHLPYPGKEWVLEMDGESIQKSML